MPADRLDEVEERPDLGWRLSPRRIEGVKGKEFLRPVIEDLHQAAALEPRSEAELQTLEEALAGFTGGERGRWVVHHDLSADSARDNLASSMKLPREGATRLRIAKQKSFVTKDL